MKQWFVAITVAIVYLAISLTLHVWSWSWIIWVIYATYRLLDNKKNKAEAYGGKNEIKIRVSYYKKAGSMWYVNGGFLTISESQIKLKSLFKPVFVFPMGKISVRRCPDEVFYKGICVEYSEFGYNLYFLRRKTADKVYRYLLEHINP